MISESPKTLDNVTRVADINPEDFVDRFVRTQTPVVIGDTQAGTPISRITTAQAATEAFGDLRIQVQQNYTSPLSRGVAAARRQGLSQKVRNKIEEWPLATYLDHVDNNPDTDLLCVEYHTPAAVRELMKDPDVCAVPWASEDLVSFMFVANQGNYAHLHFDGDFRNVLLYQVFGRKRVVMVPVSARDKISPSMNFSKLLIQNMDEEEKLDLLRYLGAYDCVINPGEAVYFPPSIWHYVEYLDTGASINFRFGRGEFARKLVDANRVPFYPDLHALLSQLATVTDQDARAGLEDRIWSEARTVLAAEYPDSAERHRAVQELYRALLDSTFPDGPLSRQVDIDCPVAERMAVERHDSPSKLWREELMLGEPI